MTLTLLSASCLAAPALGAITRRHTAAGSAAARTVLLRRADLGRHWSQESPAPRTVGFLTCSAFSPALGRVVEIGAGASPTWQQSSFGPFLSQTSYVYASAGQERVVWNQVVRPGLIRCLAASVRSDRGSHVKHERLLAVPGFGSSAAGYRVSGVISSSTGSIDIFVDMLVLGQGRTISALVISSFETPVATRFETHLAALVARRLAGS